jgi:hypothetical protein
MKKREKFCSSLCVLGLTILLVVSCSKKESAGSGSLSKDASKAAEQVSLTFADNVTVISLDMWLATGITH